MQDHVWISLALACLFCQAFCESKNGCSSRKIEIADKKLLLRLKWGNDTGTEIFTANSTDECVRLCCKKSERCNVAEFSSAVRRNNCIHAHCDPIARCLEKTEPDKSNMTTTIHQILGSGQPGPAEQSKESRSIKSRKGVGEMETTTNAPTTVKQTTATIAAKPPREPETTVVEVASTTEASDTRGSATVGSSTAMDGTVEATLIEDSTAKTEIPDLDADKMKHIVPRKGASVGHLWVPYTTPASPLQPMDQQPRPPIPTKQIVQPDAGNGPSSRVENATEYASNSNTVASTSDFRPRLTTQASKNHENLPTDYDNASNRSSTTEPVRGLPSKQAQDEDSGKLENSAISRGDSYTSTEMPPVNLVVSGSIDFLYGRATSVAAQNMDDLHFQQSIYLIVSLIIGFLVLLLVIGMVLRHVYGVWERRHYQRMDFLIDGLYNGRAAI